MNKGVVTGVGGPAGRAVASIFRSSEFTVIGTDIAAVDASLDGFFLVPPGDTREFPEVMLRILERERPTLFIPTVTEELPQASRMKSIRRGLGIKIYSPDFEAVRISNDKYLTAKTLPIFGIETPRTLADSEVNSTAEAGEILGYPFIAKPGIGRGGQCVNVCLNRLYAARERREGLVYQEFLGGDEYDVSLFAYPVGGPAVARVLLKTNLRGGIVKNPTPVEVVHEAHVAELAVKTAAALELEGLIDIDIRKGSDGTPGVLETNASVGVNVLRAEGVLESMLMHAMKHE